MPILDVEIVLKPEETLRAALASELADAAGEVLDSSPGQTWVRVRALERDRYAENGGGPPEGIYPVFVSLLKARLPEADQLKATALMLSERIAGICDRPRQNIHILYLPPAAGRVAFGGRM